MRPLPSCETLPPGRRRWWSPWTSSRSGCSCRRWCGVRPATWARWRCLGASYGQRAWQASLGARAHLQPARQRGGRSGLLHLFPPTVAPALQSPPPPQQMRPLPQPCPTHRPVPRHRHHLDTRLPLARRVFCMLRGCQVGGCLGRRPNKNVAPGLPWRPARSLSLLALALSGPARLRAPACPRHGCRQLLQRTDCSDAAVALWAAGGLAGAVSWFSVYPFDVLKTRMQAAAAASSPYRGGPAGPRSMHAGAPAWAASPCSALCPGDARCQCSTHAHLSDDVL